MRSTHIRITIHAALRASQRLHQAYEDSGDYSLEVWLKDRATELVQEDEPIEIKDGSHTYRQDNHDFIFKVDPSQPNHYVLVTVLDTDSDKVTSRSPKKRLL